MVDQISVASELYSELSPYKFRHHISCLTKQDYLSPVKFHKSELGQRYWIDICNVYKNRGINANHLYEYFGAFIEHTGSEVRELLNNLIDVNDKFYRSVGFVVLDMHGKSYETWMESVSDETAYGDELVLYSLCKLYDCHAMVYCNGRNWSTIDPINPMETAELHEACSIQLVYLSPGIFGELKCCPFVTPSKEFRTAIEIKSPPQTDSTTTTPVNLSKGDGVNSVVTIKPCTDTCKEDKKDTANNQDSTEDVYRPIVEPITPEPPEPYQPIVEPISPVQHVSDVNTKTETGPNPVVEITNNVITTDPPTTTLPGSPPITPNCEIDRPNTDDVDTDEYEDSNGSQSIINGSNAPAEGELQVDNAHVTMTPTYTDIGSKVDNMNGDNRLPETDGIITNMDNTNKRVTNNDTTTDVNVDNTSLQLDMNSDNTKGSSDIGKNQEVVNGNNYNDVGQTLDTNGHNTVDTDSQTLQQNDISNDNNNHEDVTLETVKETECSDKNTSKLDSDTTINDNNPPLDSSSSSDEPGEGDEAEAPAKDSHREIQVYGSVKVHNQVLDLWSYEAETRKVVVSVPKMADIDVKRWTDPESLKPSWQDIDPYSSLEETFSDNDDKTDSDKPNYNMRERKPKFSSSHPQCNKKDINYSDLCDDNTDPPSPKRAKRCFNSLREPSASRIAAQSKITEQQLEHQATNQPEQSDKDETDVDSNSDEPTLLMLESDIKTQKSPNHMRKNCLNPNPNQGPDQLQNHLLNLSTSSLV